MQEIIGEFIDLMREYGCEPANPAIVTPDDKIHSIATVHDKKGQRKLSYCLKVTDDIGIGWFRSFKDGTAPGETITFISSSPKKLNMAEKNQRKKRLEDMKREQDAAEKARSGRQQRMGVRLKRCVLGMKLADKHAYLTKKQVGAHGIRIRQKYGELVIPVHKMDGGVASVQKITKSGAKFFLSGGAVDGGFYPLTSAQEDKAVILVCEGFATAASVKEALGYPVLCAFNAGNLIKVSVALRAKYKDSVIVIAADNDRFLKRPDGKPRNVGMQKAMEAAEKVGGFVIEPEFPEGSESGTDWNDYILEYGAGQLHDKMRQVIAVRRGRADDVVSVPPPAPPEDAYSDWKTELICDSKGSLVRGSLRNALLFTQHHDMTRGVFCLNEFQKEIYMVRCPPWEDARSFGARRVEEVDVTNCTAFLEGFGVTSDTNKVWKAIEAVAERNKFNPAREYFDSLKWDGQKRLDTWLTYYMGAEGDAPEYLSFIGKKWLTAAVKRVYEPGCQFDHMLVIEGEQGGGKSSALRIMATFGDERPETYFRDSIKASDIGNKDTMLTLQGCIIVELSELSGFQNTSDEEMKSWIVYREDVGRIPYAKNVTVYKRHFVLAGTSNTYDYLKDRTGNRRYWPFSCSGVDLEAIERDKKQLWAEAVALYKSGLYIGPDEDEKILAEVAQAKRLPEDSWADDVKRAVDMLGMDTFTGIKISDVMTKMGVNLRDKDQRTARRIADILKKMGYENKVVRSGQSTERFWVKSDV